MVTKWLEHPLLRGRYLTDAELIQMRRRIIFQKPLLLKIYKEWYELLKKKIIGLDGIIVDLGSGPGFFEDYIPHLVKSDIYFLNFCDAVIDGMALPFANESVSAFTMTNVTHHIRDARIFFQQARRCLKPGGRIVMIEPWNTRWSKFVYSHFHSEPFDTKATSWEFSSDNPLHQSNQAIPWIIFDRDREKFTHEFPDLKIREISPMNPLRYLASGGVSMKTLIPSSLNNFMEKIENSVFQNNQFWGLFAIIVLEKDSC